MAKAETPKTQAEDATPSAAPAAPVEPVIEAASEPVVEPAPEPASAGDTPSLANPDMLGFVKITHPEGATSAGYNGQTYVADEDGVITVPNEAYAPLADHGFVQA